MNLENFSGVIIDIKRNVVITKFGECANVRKSNSSKVFESVGSWKGYTWSCDKFNEDMTGYFVNFTIGRFTGSSDIYLEYSEGSSKQNSAPEIIDIWLKISQ